MSKFYGGIVPEESLKHLTLIDRGSYVPRNRIETSDREFAEPVVIKFESMLSEERERFVEIAIEVIMEAMRGEK